MTTKYVCNDGGASQAGYSSRSDCAVRAVAIALNMPYVESRKLLQNFTRRGRQGNGVISRGVYKEDLDSALQSQGLVWHSAPKFEGRKARCSDMPHGNVIARMSHHFVAVIDGVAYDTFDCTDKMVYGFWSNKE